MGAIIANSAIALPEFARLLNIEKTLRIKLLSWPDRDAVFLEHLFTLAFGVNKDDVTCIVNESLRAFGWFH
jgi:hypothetical protein